MPKEFIVAIELGPSKMTGIAGKKNLDGSIQVLACVREDASACIRKGVVYNIDKTAQCITSIVNRLEKQLKTVVTQVYVGVGGQSIRSVRNLISKDLAGETLVTQEMVIELMDANRNMKYPDQEILDAAVQEYKVDSQYQLDPVGIQCSHIDGNFLNILQRKTFYKNLNKCFETAGINVAEMYLAPLALADSVLTEAERRSGCALVDLGADTTTVSVYSKNVLRHLAVIPLGSNNITKDIASLQMEEGDAEKMKLKYASAYTDNNEIDITASYTLGRLNIGVTDYWVNDPEQRYFLYDAHRTSHVFEANVGYDLGLASIQWYTNFAGNDGENNKGNRAYSSYLEAKVPFQLAGCDWEGAVGLVPFATSYYETNGLAVTNISLKGTKDIALSEKLSIPVFAQLIATPHTQKAFLIFGITLSP